MKEYKLEKIGFKSYIKIMFFSGIGMGIIFGLLMFLLSLLDGDSVWVRIGDKVSTGVTAGLEAVIMAPIMMCLIFSFFGLFLYLGFKITMKFKKTLNIKMEIEEKK